MNKPALVFLALTLFCLATESQAQQPSMGPLASVIEPGQDGAWSVSSGVKGVQLRNQQSSGDLTYYYVNENTAALGRRVVNLTVQVFDASDNALGGILYGYQDNPRTYFLFTVGAGGTVNLHYRGEEGFEQRFQSNLRGSTTDPVKLRLVENGREITLWANGERVGSLENQRLGQGAVGIAAADIGTFRFSQFSIESPSRRAKTQVSPESRSMGSVTWHDYMDRNTGMVQRQIPLPSGWRLDSNPNDLVSLVGPNGIVAYQKDSGRFVDSRDPSMQHSARVGGAQVAQVKSVENYLAQDFASYMAQGGYRLVRQFKMPKVQEFWERFGAAMPQGLSQKRYEAVGAQWQGSNGDQA
ncbi:MAG: hypothetical protein AAF438_23450, partial [Pseudomonadota bacterium]